jgi:hypothetical protein
MSTAREKLLKAEYFLQRMRENSSDRDAFKYNLSAFLSAVRSVRWVMRSEHRNKCSFKQWWKSKKKWAGLKNGEKLSDITDPIRAANVFFDETRNITIHTRSVQPHAHIAVEIPSSINFTDNVEPVLVHADGTRERTEANEPQSPPASEPTDTETRVEWRWYFEDLPPIVDAQDVITLSEQHVGRLEAFVSECENRFGS